MKSYYGNYLGMVIDNNDPEFRGRCQIFVPHIMPALYEGWNEKGENISINCVGDNMPQGLDSKIVEKLKKILPWAEAASPIVGQSIAGNVASAAAGGAAGGQQTDSAGGGSVQAGGQQAGSAGGGSSGGSSSLGAGGSAFKGSQKEFYDKMYDSLLRKGKEQGIPNPEVIARLGASQSALETGFGKHLAGGNNYFGIKAKPGDPGSGLQTTNEVINGRTVTIKDRFRKYDSMDDSAADYIKFLKENKRYKPVLAAATAEEAISAQGKTGYATAPDYASKLFVIDNRATGGSLSTTPSTNPGVASPGLVSGGASSSSAIQPGTGNSNPSSPKPGNQNPSSGPLNLNQSPTAAPAGAPRSGTRCIIPSANSSLDYGGLATIYADRLNNFYTEAKSLGYNISCTSAYRSIEKQAQLYAQSDKKGSVARPGSSAHNYGIATDLYVTGNGVSITKLNVAASRNGTNRDTPEFRALLAKHALHQPLHPLNGGNIVEHWHIEPTETKAAGRGAGPFRQVQLRLSNTSLPTNKETTSASQLPPAPNPLTTSTPSNTDKAGAIGPTTGQSISPPTPAVGSPQLLNPSGTAITSGPNAGSAATTPSAPTGGSGQSILARDRIERFGHELTDVQLLDRMEYVLKREGGSQASLILETACNRSMFGKGLNLKQTLFQRAYFKTAKDPTATATTPHTQFTKDIIQKVIYNGQNITDLATDQGYNDERLFMTRGFINKGVTGSWFDLRTGQKITDPARVKKLTENPGTGMEEFIYRKDGHGDGWSQAGANAKAYGIKNGIQPTSPSTFVAGTPLPPEIQNSVKSDLTGEPLRTTDSPTTVNKTDNHGPTIVKNTNNSAKGMFTFPGVGAMVWIFFREGNPLFPVYFAASYSENEWKSAYSGASLNPEGTNQGSVGSQISNSLKLNPNAGGGLEFTHIKNVADPSGSSDKAVAMIYGDDGSNMVFTKGYHQIYTRQDRRDQIDGHLYQIIGGTEEKWVEDDSNVNIRGNAFIKIGKIDGESMEAMKELSDFSRQMNNLLMDGSQ